MSINNVPLSGLLFILCHGREGGAALDEGGVAGVALAGGERCRRPRKARNRLAVITGLGRARGGLNVHSNPRYKYQMQNRSVPPMIRMTSGRYDLYTVAIPLMHPGFLEKYRELRCGESFVISPTSVVVGAADGVRLAGESDGIS